MMLGRKKTKVLEVEPRITGGPGVRVATFGDQSALSAHGGRARFRGAWHVSRVGEDEIRVGLGYVNGLEPFLSGRRLSGLDEKGAQDPRGVPLLKLKRDEYDDTGRSWICGAARINAQGRIPTPVTAVDLFLLQTKSLFSGQEFLGYFPIAVLRRDETLAGDPFGRLKQIAFFDMQHAVRKTTGREGAPGRFQHFFFPA